MPILDPNRIYDGFSNLVGGADDGRSPNLIDKVQCQEAENCIFRGGPPSTRPAFVDVVLTNTTPNLSYDAAGVYNAVGVSGESTAAFNTGLFQEASYYAPKEGQEYLMATIGGRQFQITLGHTQSGTIRELQLARRNRNTIPIAYHLQADIYFIVQDGEEAPIIFDGITARRATTDEIFTGKMMAYGMGRIVLVGVDGSIFFGDIFDGQGNGGADILNFIETQFLSEGFPSALPSSMGQPRAVQFLPVQNTQTGVGECLVFGQRGVESFYLSLPREQWKDSVFQRTALLDIGCVGHRALAVVNQDIWFRADDGWRSYRQATAEQNVWAQIPASTNVRKWITAESPDILFYCSAVNSSNRLIATCSPYPNQSKPFHNGLLALDFDILSTFGKQSAPAWDDHWSDFEQNAETGLRVLKLVEGPFDGRHRTFAFCLDPVTNYNHLVEIMPDAYQGTDTGSTKIKSTVHTRSMDFDTEFNEKQLYGGDAWVQDVTVPTDFTVQFKSDQVPDYGPWGTFSANPIVGVVQGDAEITVPGFKPRAALPKPSDASDDVSTNRLLRLFYEFQAEITWNGRATVRKFRAQAQKLLEESKAQV